MIPGIAVVGEDAIGVERPEPLQVDQVGVETVGLGDVGHGVLHRVAGEQHALLGHPHDSGVVAVDVDVDQLEAKAADVEAQALIEGQGRQDQRVDPGRALERSRFDRAPVRA